MKCTTNAKVMTFFIIFNIALPWILALVLMISNPGKLFNSKDMLELKSLEYSSPLENKLYIELIFPFYNTVKKSQNYTYAKLINYTVKKDENCPQDKKQCGYLT